MPDNESDTRFAGSAGEAVVGYRMRAFEMIWFRRLTLGQKFLVVFGLLLVLLALSLAAILFYLSMINSYVGRYSRITVPAIVTAADMRHQVLEMNRALTTLEQTASQKDREQAIRLLRENQSAAQQSLDFYRTTHAARTHPVLFRMLTEHGKVALADEEGALIGRIGTLLDELSRAWSPLQPERSGDVRSVSAQVTALSRRLDDALTSLIDVQIKINAEMKTEGNMLLGQARLVILALVILLGLVIAVIYRVVTIQIAKPLRRLAGTADRVAHGDLSAHFEAWPSKDEVGDLTRSLRSMLTTLEERTRALERKTRELESFTYSVAHDLKAPLREIEGFSSLLKRRLDGASQERSRTLDEKTEHYLDMIHTSALRMTALIDALLRYSRLEQQTLPMSKVDLRTLLEGILSDLVMSKGGSAPKISLHLPFTDVWGEPTSIRQAVVNLLDNAVKFSHGIDAPEVTIGGTETGDERIVWVRDNGIGFDPGNADKIFRLFERLHGQADYEGTGVGLAIVKLVMDKHGGRVWAESSPGKGSTFFLAFQKPRET